jgi:hypothetical protein
MAMRDCDVGRWPGDGILDWQAGDDARLGAVADIDDRHGILARRVENLLAVVEADLLVVANDQKLSLRGCAEAQCGGERRRAEKCSHGFLP